jgi:hypothetical protein
MKYKNTSKRFNNRKKDPFVEKKRKKYNNKMLKELKEE